MGVGSSGAEHRRLADLRASHKRAPVETETFLDKNRLADLRRVSYIITLFPTSRDTDFPFFRRLQVQNERTEMERMRLIGMVPKDSMGVITQTDLEKRMGVK